MFQHSPAAITLQTLMTAMETICVTRFVTTRQEATDAAATLDTLWTVISAHALVKLRERSFHKCD